MQILFKADTMLSVRRLLMAAWSQIGLSSSDAKILQAALATELGLTVDELTMKQFGEPSGLHTEFMFKKPDAIKLGHKLEQNVLANRFNPLPMHPIHRLYLEEVFDCGAHAVGTSHDFNGSNGGAVKWTYVMHGLHQI